MPQRHRHEYAADFLVASAPTRSTATESRASRACAATQPISARLKLVVLLLRGVIKLVSFVHRPALLAERPIVWQCRPASALSGLLAIQPGRLA